MITWIGRRFSHLYYWGWSFRHLLTCKYHAPKCMFCQVVITEEWQRGENTWVPLIVLAWLAVQVSMLQCGGK